MQAATTIDARARFTFLASALDGKAGFAPQVRYSVASGGMAKPESVSGPCELVPYPRESALKFAARAAVAVYENHLRSACERFAGHITRRPPVRDGLQNPLIKAIVQDADWANNTLDVFWHSFMIEAKARGSMLLLVELPAEQPISAADAHQRRLVPYLTAIEPERITDYAINEQKRFSWVKISATALIDGRHISVERYWDATVWRVMHGDRVLQEGAHPFGECPVLAFTEAGAFPHIGNFAQVADLSRRVFNARSELDEILRSQTFSLLTYQVPTGSAPNFSAAQVAATIGTHNMLVHDGITPSFIAPPDGPASVYMLVIEGLQETIRRISFAVDDAKYAAAESGAALTIRFQALNGALSSFSQRMQDLEMRMWDLVSRHLIVQSRPACQWATDYSLADTVRELDVLAAMQAAGFPEPALAEQRKRIAGEAFDSLDEETLAAVMAAIDAGAQERPPGTMPPVTPQPSGTPTP